MIAALFYRFTLGLALMVGAIPFVLAAEPNALMAPIPVTVTNATITRTITPPGSIAPAASPGTAGNPAGAAAGTPECTPARRDRGLCKPVAAAQTSRTVVAPAVSTLTPLSAAPVPSLISSPFAPLTAGNRSAREPNQLVIYFPDIYSAIRGFERINREYGFAPAQRVPLGALGGVIALYRGDDYDLDQLRGRLQQAMPEAAVDFNTRYYPEGGPRQYFSARLGLNAISPGSSNVPIGMVDTGVEETPALASSRLIRRSFLSESDRPASLEHGTSVALLLAGEDRAHGFYGAAPGATLYVASIMRRADAHDSTNTLILAQALDWLAAQKIRVINLSLGGPGDAIMARIFEKLVRSPIVIVAAAGNGGPKAPPSYPAAYPGVLAVTATNAADNIYAQANQGDYIMLAAPGEDLWVPSRDGGQYISGTSFAAALVSGSISHMLAVAQGMTPSDIQRYLCRYARDLGAPGRDPVFGCGLLQIGTVMAALPGAINTAKKD